MAMTGDFPVNAFNYIPQSPSTGWVPSTSGNYWPNQPYLPWQYQPVPYQTPCQTCGRCPSCGSYKPYPTWTYNPAYTWTISSGNAAAAPNIGYLTNTIVNTCPSTPDDGECEHD